MKKFGAVRLFFLLVLVLSLSVIPTIGTYYSKNDITKQRFFGNVANETVILTIWNVDTFEGGNTGKSTILEKVSKEFEKQNKGVFVLVLNLTVEEFLTKIENEKPDVVSFGYGLYENLCEYVLDLANNNNLFQNIQESSLKNGKFLAYPWCLGAYFVLATEESLSKANAPTESIIKNCMSYGYEKKIGKKSQQIFSIEMGVNAFCDAKSAISSEVEFNSGAVDSDWQNQSYYDAYVRFLKGKSTFLLGTQRDVARLENKKTQGAVQEIYGEALLTTDLIQYVSAASTENLEKEQLSKFFCNFLVSDYVQSMLLGFGLLPTCSVDAICESKILLAAYEEIAKMKICAIR